MTELLIGCGNDRGKRIAAPGKLPVWDDLTTLDYDPDCRADVEWDLHNLPLPFEADQFDEIHAYEVLEHVGAQGDFRTFFAQWSEFWRLLKPGGLFCGTVPAPGSVWVFGDPGHTRVIQPENFVYLNQAEYTKQVGVTQLTDYRRYFREDFDVVYIGVKETSVFFVLKAVKPSRISV